MCGLSRSEVEVSVIARTDLTVEPVAGAIGAMVTGLDLRTVETTADLAPLIDAIAQHLVVFLPGQQIDLDGLERVTDLLGGCDTTPFVKPVEGRPNVIRVLKEAKDGMNFANAWHSDLSYLAAPPSYTVLHAYEIPPFGGDTLWANQYRAFETLSPGLQRTLKGLKAVHSAAMAYGSDGVFARAKNSTSMEVEPSAEAHRTKTHPAVIRNPLTGRAALYVNPVYTTRFQGWSEEDSQPLLQHLFRHSVSENLTCRLRWQPGTLAIWDNRCTQHNGLNDVSGQRRVLYRTSVRGSTPEAAG